MTKNKRADAENAEKGIKIIRGIWFITGTICLTLGAIGIVLPILPTTPFLLAAAACYYKSSPRMHKWLLNNKWFGEYIKNYKEGKGIPKKTKVTALTVLWVTIGVSTFFFLDRLLPAVLVLPMQLVMISVALIVTIYMLRLPTYQKT
jgi:uncharacterized membrane protein YbaN (DUF454 family)